jgi:hypothetical protein
MAQNFYHDTLTVEAGKTKFYHNKISALAVEELIDIDNDFRMLKKWALEDILNDFRMVGLTTVISDIDNDFRMIGAILKDIDNDFRMIGELERIDIDNDFRSRKQVVYDISNKISTVKISAEDMDCKFNSAIEVEKNIDNIIHWNQGQISDIDNDFRNKKLERNNVTNDFRMMSPWQIAQAGDVKYQSLGKEYVKVYIGGAEQTDIDVDSISVTRVKNGASSASFALGRPYDDTKPTQESIVEIKYNNWIVFKGYVVSVSATDSPESIKVDCLDEYWKINRDKKYFYVGRQPQDANEYYYETISEALSGIGVNFGIGDFIPQTIDFYGIGHSDAITKLVENCGNFGWFFEPDGNKYLWTAGNGALINLPQQELGKNIELYQVIRHNINENVEDIVNRFRVQMGSKNPRKNTDNSEEGTGLKDDYGWIFYGHYNAIPAWDSRLEVLAKDSNDGTGYDWQDSTKDYSNVFKKFWLPNLNPSRESWSDRRPPVVYTHYNALDAISLGLSPFTVTRITDGFTIDYGSMSELEDMMGNKYYANMPSITFSEPQMNIKLNEHEEWEKIYAKNIELQICKELKIGYNPDDETPTGPDDEPDETDLMFYTNKMGSYPVTITDVLYLTNLTIQEGFTIYDYIEVPCKKWVWDATQHKNILTETTCMKKIIIEKVPSWDDTEFAKDYAYWQLSKLCDKKISGTIDLTIDAIFYYNINLSKRVKINNVVEPVNIQSITYNFNNFTATLSVENGRYYKRSESIPYRGE